MRYPAGMHRPKRAILLIGGGSVALGGLLLAHHLVEAPIARQMVTHILLMSFVAPMVAGWTVRKLGSPLGDGLPRLLFAATAIQLVAIYLWHLPPGFDIAAAMPRGRLLMHATLLSAATWYWYAIFASLSRHRWHALFSLLVTGKLFCILGALFVFSPREILSSSLPTAGYNVLQDQQLAGLAMLAACPATYIGAAFLVTLGGLPRMRGSPGAVTSCPVRGAEQS